MLGFGRTTVASSMTTIYLFLFILLINQFLLVRTFRLSNSDLDQNESDDARRAIIRRLVFANFDNPEESSDETDLQVPTIRRRFCCMNPLSGRKRFIRDLTKKQIATRLS